MARELSHSISVKTCLLSRSLSPAGSEVSSEAHGNSLCLKMEQLALTAADIWVQRMYRTFMVRYTPFG